MNRKLTKKVWQGGSLILGLYALLALRHGWPMHGALILVFVITFVAAVVHFPSFLSSRLDRGSTKPPRAEERPTP